MVLGRGKHSHSTRSRLLRAGGNVLFAVALVVGTQPWWSGIPTWYQQRQMRARMASQMRHVDEVRPARRVDTSTPVGPYATWRQEDLAYWLGLKDGQMFGRLTATKAGIDTVLVRGTGKAALRSGPGWVKSTSLPGERGTVGISGHRTTYGGPFRKLDKLVPGDEIVLESPFRRYEYRVVRQRIVKPDDTTVFDPTKKPTLALTACHPLYSARQRLVVSAELVKVTRRAARR